MKKILFSLFCLVGITSCTKEFLPDPDVPGRSSVVARTITPRTNPYIDWEDTTKINIVGHGLVTQPWYSGAQGSILIIYCRIINGPTVGNCSIIFVPTNRKMRSAIRTT